MALHVEHRPSWSLAAAATGVAIAILLAGLGLFGTPTSPARPPPAPNGSPSFSIIDESKALGTVFHPGVILGAAGNGSTVLMGGIGVYNKPTDFTLPVAASLVGTHGSAAVSNLTPQMNDVFWSGGVYALGWNGSAWLVGGQASWGGQAYSFGSALTLNGSRIVNVTSVLGRYFVGGGIFGIGWNGTAWLVGGNSSGGVVLVGLRGDAVTNYTADIRWYYNLGWIQNIAWNGGEWLVGGREIFGSLRGHAFHDLLPGSPFRDNGVWVVDWNGSAWLAGGGAGKLMVVENDIARPGPVLPTLFNQAVLLIGHVRDAWVIGGKGTTPAGGIAADLVYLWGSGGPWNTMDLTSLIPFSFDQGEIQAGGPAPSFASGSSVDFVLVGEGSYDNLSGYGVGAVAILSIQWSA